MGNIYTDTHSSMQSIKYNKENRPLLCQIYDILGEIQTQDKQLLVIAHIVIKGNEVVDKTTK